MSGILVKLLSQLVPIDSLELKTAKIDRSLKKLSDIHEPFKNHIKEKYYDFKETLINQLTIDSKINNFSMILDKIQNLKWFYNNFSRMFGYIENKIKSEKKELTCKDLNLILNHLKFQVDWLDEKADIAYDSYLIFESNQKSTTVWKNSKIGMVQFLDPATDDIRYFHIPKNFCVDDLTIYVIDNDNINVYDSFGTAFGCFKLQKPRKYISIHENQIYAHDLLDQDYRKSGRTSHYTHETGELYDKSGNFVKEYRHLLVPEITLKYY